MRLANGPPTIPIGAPLLKSAPVRCNWRARTETTDTVAASSFQPCLDPLQALLERAARTPLDNRFADHAQRAAQRVDARAVGVDDVDGVAGRGVGDDRHRERRVDVAARVDVLRSEERRV